MSENFVYNTSEKENCWYKGICDHKNCGDVLCMRNYKMQFLVSSSQLGGKQTHSIPLKPDGVDVDAFKHLKDIKDNISTFVKDGKSLLIYSEHTGNGKTEWSIKLLLSWFNSVWHKTDFECRGLFVSMPKFVRAMKENISKPNEYYEYVNNHICDADLVVWDEINYKEWSSYEQDYMLDVISQRIANGKANIYTTNYGLKVIQDKLGTRLASRIVGYSDCVEFKGKDRRGRSVSNDGK